MDIVKKIFTKDTSIIIMKEPKETFKMSKNRFFDNRDMVGKKLADYLRAEGYTKLSFSQLTDISRPTLDKFLSGNVNSESCFEKHFQKILHALNITGDELLEFHRNDKNHNSVVYSKNDPAEHQPSQKAESQLDLLSDLLTICEIYY
jgi:transcriptional regulator with XRE-family HTH domain